MLEARARDIPMGNSLGVLYEDLSAWSQECARAQFIDAGPGDGYVYRGTWGGGASLNRNRPKELPHKSAVATCIECGCNDLRACAGGCCWVRVDYDVGFGICSQCSHGLAAWDRGERKLAPGVVYEIHDRK